MAKFRNTKTAVDKFKARCPHCGAFHFVDAKTWAMFGVDTECMTCVDWNHVDFMKRSAKRLGLTCVAGCKCGFGE